MTKRSKTFGQRKKKTTEVVETAESPIINLPLSHSKIEPSELLKSGVFAEALIETFHTMKYPNQSISDVVERLKKLLDHVINLFTEALEKAGRPCGVLARHGEYYSGLGNKLGDSIIFRAVEDLPYYCLLSKSADLKRYSYEPHCRLFEIIGAYHLVTEIHKLQAKETVRRKTDDHLIAIQIGPSIVCAHLTLIWLEFALPITSALNNSDLKAANMAFTSYRSKTAKFLHDIPSWISDYANLKVLFADYADAYPIISHRVLLPETKRLNNLPMTEFIYKLIIDVMSEMQAKAIAQQQSRQ